MTWQKKRVLVTVKAAPERSKKYGECVCTAGITEEGEFIRLYPISLDVFRRGPRFKKFSWIEVECEKAQGEKLRRKESYRIREGSLRVVDTSLCENPVDWAGREKVLAHLRSPSVESLVQAFDADRTSLGFIRVGELQRFYKSEELNVEGADGPRIMQATFDAMGGMGRPKWILNQIPHVFRYQFRCGVPDNSCRGHDMTCEDWELFESNRKWSERYRTPELLWEKLHDRYFTRMKDADLQFFMGTESQYGSWLIVGLYYPKRPVTFPAIR
jgi:hypothetical protein